MSAVCTSVSVHGHCCRHLHFLLLLLLFLLPPLAAGQDDEYSSAFVVHQHLAFQGVSNLETLSFWTFR